MATFENRVPGGNLDSKKPFEPSESILRQLVSHKNLLMGLGTQNCLAK